MEHVETDLKKSKKVIECFLKNSVSVTIDCSLVWFETLELVCNFFSSCEEWRRFFHFVNFGERNVVS
jgi:hypothetical protein